jgi:hypothetical protein
MSIRNGMSIRNLNPEQTQIGGSHLSSAYQMIFFTQNAANCQLQDWQAQKKVEAVQKPFDSTISAYITSDTHPGK